MLILVTIFTPLIVNAIFHINVLWVEARLLLAEMTGLQNVLGCVCNF